MEPRFVTVTSRVGLAAALVAGFAFRAAGCDLALVLAVDVSGSVDSQEFSTQMQGLAAGLRDPVVADALVRGEASVALVQWSGTMRQVLSVPFVQVRGAEDIEALAQAIATTPRAWPFFSTAIGEALRFSAATFQAVPDCRRRVIDISSDGRSNEGIRPTAVVDFLQDAGVTVNALVIEDDDERLPGYFLENVIFGSGAFVVTAASYREFPERMQRKLRRETERQISLLPSATMQVGSAAD